MLTITGYPDRIYAHPCDTVKFMVSCETPITYRAHLVRIICADDNPKGPGYKEEEIASEINGEYQGRKQHIHAGSYVTVPDARPLSRLESFTVQAFIWPTTPQKGKQGLISKWSAKDNSGFALIIDEQGSIALEIGDGKGAIERVSVQRVLQLKRWYRVGAAYDATTGTILVYQLPLIPVPEIADGGTIEKTSVVRMAKNKSALVFAAMAAPTHSGLDFYYNGKIDGPRLTSRALGMFDCEALIDQIPQRLILDIVGQWDFSRKMDSQTAYDISVNRLHGNVVNFPARAMTGRNWSGEIMNYNEDPSQWGAIHFHDDDVYDAGWDADFSLTIPAALKSGIYAARLRSDDDEEHIWFTIGPEPDKESEIALLLPTASYMAYGNDRLGMDGGGAELLNDILNVINPHEIFLNDHVEYGGSLYDAHSDGSGICYSSRLRPLVNMRPKRQGTLGGFGGSKLWQFPADTHITDWLEAKNFNYDVLTDDELHDRGYQLLAPYKVLISGTHPEYWSTEMWDAFDAFRQRGGRIMYLGGDGWYWRVAYHPDYPGIVELRRTESGVRAWPAAPGEYYQSFDRRQGGLWSRLGRPPHGLVGVGFAAQGFDISSYYKRLPDSYKPEVRFVFEGVGDEKIGDFGLIGGGAAGLEVDRSGADVGTPSNAYILARSENHTNTYLIVPEEFLETAPGLGAEENVLARADIVFFTMPNDGAVFSVGSIAWAGSLSHNNYRNNVSQITENVLLRFLDPTPFAT
ncbi:N,N-dimethylformamidase beta subunit family domain-containing protein [Hyphomicrobium sp.]|jgi:N,N-dimethylformamidase|uniref:N,N-dimethylformamidase beta subunit family domain-containing protein n=1 Tax=Hyphomicrobium sp. TaxID=82 RepID=UPI003568ABC0